MSSKMLLLAIMSILLFQTLAKGGKRGYQAWKRDYKSKTKIDDSEDVFRNIIYEENVRKIEKHNEEAEVSEEAE